MSVVILGGNQRMVRRYKEICGEYNCDAKVFSKPVGSLKRKIGRPDLLIFFTDAMSHKMVQAAISEVKGHDTTIARCRSSSASALKEVLDYHTQQAKACRYPPSEH